MKCEIHFASLVFERSGSEWERERLSEMRSKEKPWTASCVFFFVVICWRCFIFFVREMNNVRENTIYMWRLILIHEHEYIYSYIKVYLKYFSPLLLLPTYHARMRHTSFSYTMIGKPMSVGWDASSFYLHCWIMNAWMQQIKINNNNF